MTSQFAVHNSTHVFILQLFIPKIDTSALAGLILSWVCDVVNSTKRQAEISARDSCVTQVEIIWSTDYEQCWERHTIVTIDKFYCRGPAFLFFRRDIKCLATENYSYGGVKIAGRR